MQNPRYPPLPFNPFPELPVYDLGNNSCAYDDRQVDYQKLQAEARAREAPNLQPASEGSAASLLGCPAGTLCLEIAPNPPGYFDLTVRGTLSGVTYELFTSVDLSQPVWNPYEIFTATADPTVFTYAHSDPMNFYLVARPNEPVVTVSVTAFQDGWEPNLDNGDPGERAKFAVFRDNPSTSALQVPYHVSGTALNGVDYAPLSGVVTIPAGELLTEFDVNPLGDYLIEGNETVTISLLTNGYLILPGYGSATAVIEDNVFTTVVPNVGGAVGIDYHPPTESVLISGSFVDNYNFLRLHNDGGTTAHSVWSTIQNLQGQADEEIKIATVKTTANGFIQGQTYFGTDTPGVIGRLSPDGTVPTLNWATLPGVTEHLRGSLHMDQSGVFGGDLIVVPSDAEQTTTEKTVWRVNSSGAPQLIASIDTPHLEGLVTLPNDVSTWGSCAGKILTGDEFAGKIYTISSEGVVTTFGDLPIRPEDFDVIPPNQDLYCALPSPDKILKLSRQYLVDYVGDLLITQAGEQPGIDAKLFIVRWDGNNFVIRKTVSLLSFLGGAFEHVTFAPIDLPHLPYQ